MKILFVDAEAYRHEIAQRLFGAFDLWHAYTVGKAIQELESAERFDVVCLDHDMADDGTSGLDVARAIAAMKRKQRLVWIHSWNPVGVQRITGALDGHVQWVARTFSEDACKMMVGVCKMLEADKKAALRAAGDQHDWDECDALEGEYKP